MQMAIRILIALVVSIVMVFVTTTLLTFFDISIQSYLIYLLYLVALLWLFAFLPLNPPDIFD